MLETDIDTKTDIVCLFETDIDNNCLFDTENDTDTDIVWHWHLHWQPTDTCHSINTPVFAKL